jgi:hypothetical protein
VPGKKDELDDFHAILTGGTTGEVFLNQYDKIFGFVHSHGSTRDYRLGRGRMKRLRDEVTPVARFVRTCAEPEDRIWFTMFGR